MNCYNGIFYKLEYNGNDEIHVTDGLLSVGLVSFSIIKYLFWSKISLYLIVPYYFAVLVAYDVFIKHSSLTVKILSLIFDHFVMLDIWSGIMYNYNGEIDYLSLLSLSIINVLINKCIESNGREYFPLYILKPICVLFPIIIHPYIVLVISVGILISSTKNNKFISLIGVSIISHILTNYYLKTNYGIVLNTILPLNLLHLLYQILTMIDMDNVNLEDRSSFGMFVSILPFPVLEMASAIDVLTVLNFMIRIKRDYIFNPPNRILCIGIFDVVLPSDIKFIEQEAHNNVVDILLLDNDILINYYNYTPTFTTEERYIIAKNQKHVNNVFIITRFNDLFYMQDYLRIIPMLNINNYCDSNTMRKITSSNSSDSLTALNNVREIIHQNYYKDITNELNKIQAQHNIVQATTFRSKYSRIIR